MEEVKSTNFIEEIIDNDLASGKHSEIITRFPPEPNGYLHIGHAKSICINFGIKSKYSGKCNLRFDDTNPSKEDVEYVNSIKEDIAWLGFEWDKELYASDYFEKMYNCAVILIKKGLAYVCDLTQEEIRSTRGTLKDAGVNSSYRDRSVEDNLQLFSDMRAGKFLDGEKVLRAKIDMSSPNMNMRDPVIYRISRASHHRTGTAWCIYPMYDFAHPLEDAIEQITHSICTLEFEDHRPLYDWFTLNCDFITRPRQIEFARLNINRTVMSKRYLKSLVDNGLVNEWCDPRMPTISGMRRRGYPAEAIRNFCATIGVAKSNSIVDNKLLEHCVRDILNSSAKRVMVVTEPLKLIIDNYPKGASEIVSIDDNPLNKESKHDCTFSREIYIEREDFSLNPPPKYRRLKPDGKVRLKGAYILEYSHVDQDSEDNITAVHCTYIEDSKSGGVNAGIKVKGVVHWVDSANNVAITINNYESLLLEDESLALDERFNTTSSKPNHQALAEAEILNSRAYDKFQFLRKGYYMAIDGFDKTKPIFNSIVALKDAFNK